MRQKWQQVGNTIFYRSELKWEPLTPQQNWGPTSLGKADHWPQSLKRMLSIILNSKFTMFLFWRNEHFCFYNDAHRPGLGNNGKHPYALAKPGAELWPEISEFIKPLIEQVFEGGEAVWYEDQLLPNYRNGKMEDVYWWTLTYIPCLTILVVLFVKAVPPLKRLCFV